ncbi:SsgA family sporulation/cell division regulator [Streptomyces sp. NPDC048192]|uniref:SsgA family sporulation/cell division regulator n=1 Tax=Streptomyces sp. NPDC048192 TaxID=3365510 RepID=UPI00371EDA3B
MITTILTDMRAHLVVSQESSVPVWMTLRYESTDPYAVRVVFRISDDETVEWVFARELLAEGLHQPAGEGDVHVRPIQSPARSAMRVTLASPTGTALLEAPAQQLASFLQRTDAAVPPGIEHEHLDVDSELAHIFADS